MVRKKIKITYMKTTISFYLEIQFFNCYMATKKSVIPLIRSIIGLKKLVQHLNPLNQGNPKSNMIYTVYYNYQYTERANINSLE